MKIVLNGIRMHGRMYLSGFKSQGVNIKDIPPYFTIEIDTEKIKVREKSND